MENININGYTVCFLPDDKLKTASAIVYIRLPLSEETVSYGSILPAVLSRGCEKIPETADFNIYLEKLFGASFSFNVSKRGAEQVIALRFKTLADRFAADGEKPFLDLLRLSGEVLFHPLIENGGFRASYVEREKENLKQYIEGLVNDKRKYAKMRLISEMCKGEEYCISENGTIEQVDAITPSSLYEKYNYILDHANISFYITDRFDKAEVLPVLESILKDRKAGSAAMQRPMIKDAPEAVRTVEESAPVTQGKLSIGFRTEITRTDDRFYAMMVFNSLFGGAPYSKLFTNVREKMSLAYYASSEFVSLKGLVLVNSGIEFRNFSLARDEIFAQLEELKKGNFTDADIESAKLDITDSLKGVCDYGEALAEFYSSLAACGVSDTPQTVSEKVMRVTKEDIIQAARTVRADTVYFLKGEN